MRNPCAKMRKVNKPYEIWATANGEWKWLVLKKWQIDDNKPYARWFCAVQSPMTGGHYDMGDCYVREIKAVATRTWKENDVPLDECAEERVTLKRWLRAKGFNIHPESSTEFLRHLVQELKRAHIKDDVAAVCEKVASKTPYGDIAELLAILQLIVDANGDIYTDAPECRDSVNRMRGYIVAAEMLLRKYSAGEVSAVAEKVWK